MVVDAAIAEGMFGQALEFDGSDDVYLETPDFGEHEELTIAAWFKMSGRPDSWRVIYNVNGWSTGWVHHQIHPNNTMEFSINSIGDQFGESVFDAEELDAWHHSAVVYSASEQSIQFYVDGELNKEAEWGGIPAVLGEGRIGGWDGGGRGFEGLLDEVTFLGFAATEEEIKGLMENGASPTEFQITEITRGGEDVALTWQSESGGYYAVDTSTDLVSWEVIVTEIPEGGATTETASYEDTGVPMDLSALYYRVRQVAAPAIYFTDFEGENGAEGWTAMTDSGSVEWELGTPAVDGLMVAASGTQAWGTDLDSHYTSEFNLARLRSPAIDASAKTTPNLSFNYFIDSTVDVEGGQLRLLDENGDELWTQNQDDILSGQTGAWTPFSIRFPQAARGVKVILEFAFLTDDDGNVGVGWYIDDVSVD